MNVIKVENVYKTFKIGKDTDKTLKELFVKKKRQVVSSNEVLKGVSFEIEKGTSVGLIGKNGSGKSTLLKLISRIMYPDSGDISVKGRVSSLLELGAGFHPDLTGRENIYVNASIFGLTRKEVEAKIDSIIEFSELEYFIDTPVRTYSSGMYTRLAFAVAINVDADVLLIDEILSVGDAAFQSKCFNKLQEIKNSGCTIVIVTHDLGSLERLSERVIWLHNGKIYRDDKPSIVKGEYLSTVMNESLVSEQEEVSDLVEEQKQEQDIDVFTENKSNRLEEHENVDKYKHRYGNGFIEVQDVKMTCFGKETDVFATGSDVDIKVKYKINNKEAVDAPIFGFGIFDLNGQLLYGTNTEIEGVGNINVTDDGEYTIKIENLSFISGTYSLQVAIVSGSHIPYDYYNNCMSFKVYSPKSDVGITRIEHKWVF